MRIDISLRTPDFGVGDLRREYACATKALRQAKRAVVQCINPRSKPALEADLVSAQEALGAVEVAVREFPW